MRRGRFVGTRFKLLHKMKKIEIVQLLLERGADVNGMHFKLLHPETMLM